MTSIPIVIRDNVMVILCSASDKKLIKEGMTYMGPWQSFGNVQGKERDSISCILHYMELEKNC